MRKGHLSSGQKAQTGPASTNKEQTPFPKRQMLILGESSPSKRVLIGSSTRVSLVGCPNGLTLTFPTALCRICEPIAFMSIFPYIYYMIKDFNITEDESKISVYAGMVTSAFTLAEFSTGVMWGRLSDKFGRKPILLMGLLGTAISALIFGFAESLPVALFARAMGGLLNG